MKKLMKRIEAWMNAVTFAEAGEPELAREFLGVKPKAADLEPLAIPGVKVWFGTVTDFVLGRPEGSASEPLDFPGVKIWFGTAALAVAE